MNTFTKILMCGTLAVTVLLVANVSFGADPVAPLNGTDNFDSDVGEFNLKVDTDGKEIKADDFVVIQGNQDTRYTIDTSSGKGEAKRVATVVKEAGTVLYRVSGTYVGGGGGATTSTTALLEFH